MVGVCGGEGVGLLEAVVARLGGLGLHALHSGGRLGLRGRFGGADHDVVKARGLAEPLLLSHRHHEDAESATRLPVLGTGAGDRLTRADLVAGIHPSRRDRDRGHFPAVDHLGKHAQGAERLVGRGRVVGVQAGDHARAEPVVPREQALHPLKARERVAVVALGLAHADHLVARAGRVGLYRPLVGIDARRNRGLGDLARLDVVGGDEDVKGRVPAHLLLVVVQAVRVGREHVGHAVCGDDADVGGTLHPVLADEVGGGLEGVGADDDSAGGGHFGVPLSGGVAWVARGAGVARRLRVGTWVVGRGWGRYSFPPMYQPMAKSAAIIATCASMVPMVVPFGYHGGTRLGNRVPHLVGLRLSPHDDA